MNNLPVVYGLCMILFSIGLYGVISKRNVIKIIISLIIMENAVNLFILLVGYKRGGIAPLIRDGRIVEKFASNAVDPFAQAMVVISIVIGLSITALLVAIAVRIYERYSTFDINYINDLKR